MNPSFQPRSCILWTTWPARLSKDQPGFRRRMREPLRVQVAELTRWMHCYYSNLIEGEQTRVRDIEAALKHDFAADPKKRDLQQLSLAHLDVQQWAALQTVSPFTHEFIRARRISTRSGSSYRGNVTVDAARTVISCARTSRRHAASLPCISATRSGCIAARS